MPRICGTTSNYPLALSTREGILDTFFSVCRKIVEDHNYEMSESRDQPKYVLTPKPMYFLMAEVCLPFLSLLSFKCRIFFLL